MKKESNLKRLMGYAGRHRYLTYASWVLSVISALTALVPFIYIWRIIHDVLDVAPDFGRATGLVRFGVMAVVFAVLSYLIYIGALMCSHLSAFRVATNLRLEVTEHIAKLPLGFVDSFGSGKLRKIISDSTGATETYFSRTSFRIRRALSLRQSGFWFCCSCSTGGSGCSVLFRFFSASR